MKKYRGLCWQSTGLYFCGDGGGWLSVNPVGGCLLWKCNCRWLSFSKCSSVVILRSDGMGSLNTKKNEKKLFQFFKGELSRKKKLRGWWGWLIFDLMGGGPQHELNLMSDGGKIKVPTKTLIFFTGTALRVAVYTLTRLLLQESDLIEPCSLSPVCLNTWDHYGLILKIPSYPNFRVSDARTLLLQASSQASSGALRPKLLNDWFS